MGFFRERNRPRHTRASEIGCFFPKKEKKASSVSRLEATTKHARTGIFQLTRRFHRFHVGRFEWHVGCDWFFLFRTGDLGGWIGLFGDFQRFIVVRGQLGIVVVVNLLLTGLAGFFVSAKESWPMEQWREGRERRRRSVLSENETAAPIARQKQPGNKNVEQQRSTAQVLCICTVESPKMANDN